MTGSIYMAASGALAYKKRLEVLSNNLANMNTVGFKQEKNCFQAFYLSESMKSNKPDDKNSNASQAPSFWIQLKARTDFSSGALKATGKNFDLALIGPGFFTVQTPNGIQYTRRGDFTINPQGMLVTQEGWPVLGEGGEIEAETQVDISDTGGYKFSVDENGKVSVDGKQIDKLRIVDFPKPNSLEKVGHSFFKPLDVNTTEADAEGFQISQGFVELSNVDGVKMMTELIEVLRGYEAYQKVIRSIDDVNAKVIEEVGRPV